MGCTDCYHRRVVQVSNLAPLQVIHSNWACIQALYMEVQADMGNTLLQVVEMGG